MRKFFYTAVLLLGLIILPSCQKNDNKDVDIDDYATAIIGTWQIVREEDYEHGKLVDTIPYGPEDLCYLTFTESGTMIDEENGRALISSYVVRGKTLIVYYDWGSDSTEIKKLTSTELFIVFEEEVKDDIYSLLCCRKIE